jgi:hypothetical protein
MYLKALSTLQDELGQHNDLVVADRMLQRIGRRRRTGRRPASTSRAATCGRYIPSAVSIPLKYAGSCTRCGCRRAHLNRDYLT